MTFTAKFVCITHHFILVRHNSFGLGVGRERWWFEHSVSWLLVWLSAEASENVSWLRLSLLRGWGYLTLAFTGKFLYIAHNFILLGHNVSGFGVDREGWWFEHSVSWFWVWLSAGVARNVSWHWLSPLRWWGSLIVVFTGKFVYVAHHFILLQQNAFGLGVDWKGWWFEHSVSWLQVWLWAEGAKNVSWPLLSPLRGFYSLTMAFTDKFVYIAHHFILLQHMPLGLVLIGREGGLRTLCHGCRFNY